jgi:hypothetical protein
VKVPEIHKGHCSGCPYDFGQSATEMAYNLGCLPSVGELETQCSAEDKAWACHDRPEQVCCGFAASRKNSIGKDLLTVPGIHMPLVLSDTGTL